MTESLLISKTFHKNKPSVINFHNTTTLKDPSRFWKIAWGPSRILSRILANIFMKYLTGSSKFLLQEFFLKDFLTCGGRCTTCLSLRFVCFSVDLLFFNTLINVMASLYRKGTSFPVEQQQQQKKLA